MKRFSGDDTHFCIHTVSLIYLILMILLKVLGVEYILLTHRRNALP